MTPRGYIKSKYVIKIYENSLNTNSAEWEANTSYEPLTIVTYNNKSYLSKTNVPSSASNPASEPAYWILVGVNNEVDSIKQTLMKLESDLSTITRTGAINSGTKLNKETFFYLNGELVQAIADINNGDSFTLNTNYKAVSNDDGVLNQIGTTNNSAFSVTTHNNAVVVNSIFKQRNGVLDCHMDVNFTNVALNTEVNTLTINDLTAQGYSKSALYTSGVILSKDNTSQIGTFILVADEVYTRVSQAVEGVFSFVLVKE